MVPSANAQAAETSIDAGRIAYEAPVLRALGDIRDMTLGGSLGNGDSGASAGVQLPTP